MKANHWLIAAVAILSIALAAESVYLYQVKRSAQSTEPRPEYPARTIRTQTAAASAPGASVRQSYDPFFHSGFDVWDPFEEMDQIQGMMNRMFRDSFNRGFSGGGFSGRHGFTYQPDLNVQETNDAYLVSLDLPGVEKDKISVKVQNGVLTVSGERRSDTETSDDSKGFYRMEKSYGSFMRSFPLPSDADSEGMTAESKNGILTVHLPKIKNALSPAKNIQVE